MSPILHIFFMTYDKSLHTEQEVKSIVIIFANFEKVKLILRIKIQGFALFLPGFVYIF